MDSTTYQYAVEQLLNLKGTAWFLIFTTSFILTIGAFFLFRFIFGSVISSQKDLIEAKSKMVEHYQEVTERLNNDLEKAQKSFHQLAVEKEEATAKIAGNAEEAHKLLTEKGRYQQDVIFMTLTLAWLKLVSAYKSLYILFLFKSILWTAFNRTTTADAAEEVIGYMSIVDSIGHDLHERVKKFQAILQNTSDNGGPGNYRQLFVITEDKLDDIDARIESVADFLNTQRGGNTRSTARPAIKWQVNC